MTVELRDYQAECLGAIGRGYRAGIRRQLVCLPTGTGKTVVFAEFPRYFRMQNQMLVLAHREELLVQARDKIRRADPTLRVGIEMATQQAAPDSQVVVASVPTLGRKGSARLQRLDPDRFFLIVVDEAHHATAASYRRVLDHFGVFAPDTRKLLVGFTATPKRGDGQGLDEVFEDITFSKTLPEMISAGHLAPVAGYRVETEVDLSGVRTRMGDYVSAQLSDAVNVEERNRIVVEVHREHLTGRPTLCFCVDVAHAEALAAAFRAAGVRSASVTGELDRTVRARTLEEFRQGHLEVVTNCMVLTEGYDEPSVAGILLARPTRSSLLYTQMIGRGTRLHPGKDDVTVIDIVDVTRDHKLATLPSLFGLAAEFNLEGRTTTQAQDAIRWVEANRPWVSVNSVRSLSELRYRCQKIDLLDLQTPSELAGVCELAWAGTAAGAYRLGLARGEALSIAPTILGDWEVVLRRGARETRLARALTPARAVGKAEAFVREQRSDALGLVLASTRWRRAPASEKQLQILRARGIEAPDGLTKGQASHLIGMLPAPG